MTRTLALASLTLLFAVQGAGLAGATPRRDGPSGERRRDATAARGAAKAPGRETTAGKQRPRATASPKRTALWSPPPGPLSLASARRLLRVPSSTVSLGSTGSGRLLHARRIRERGRHYRFFPHIAERQTHWGTDELQELLDRASRAVARKHRGAQLRVGNVSLRRGGRSPWHRSHQSGRDVDLCFYTRDRKGRVVVMDDFRKFGRNGISRDGQLVFDVARNLDLAIALVTPVSAVDGSAVQWAFVSRWLKKRMLQLAVKRGVSVETLARLDAVLRQPGDSAPHDDHFHVRLYCSLEDRKHGCLDRGPLRDWVDRGDAAFDAHVARVVEASALRSSAKLRLRAVQLLERMEAATAFQAFVDRLADSDARVREAALAAVARLQLRDAAPGLLAALKATPNPTWAVRLFDTWAGLRPEGVSDIAAAVLSKPEAYVHPKALASVRKPVRLRAAAVLTQEGGRAAVPALIAALTSRSLNVRLAAHAALVAITNQPVRSRHLKSKAKRRWRKTASAWQQFWRQNQGRDWQIWMKKGFRDHGVRLTKGPRFVKRDVPRLIRALTARKAHVARNAARVLERITGHKPWVRKPTRRKLRRHWTWWWRKRGKRLQLQG